MQVDEKPENFIGGWLWNRTKYRPNGTLHACDSYRICCSSGMRHGVFIHETGNILELINAPICLNCIHKMESLGISYKDGQFYSKSDGKD